MSKLTIHTRHLVGMLKDLQRTASTEPLLPEVNSVLLHTTRAEIPLEDIKTRDEDEETLIEVVTTDVLVGTSTDRTVIAQAHAPCTGSLRGPVLINAAHAKKIVGVFEPLWKASPKTSPHEVVLDLSGDVLRVQEDGTKIPNPVVLLIGILDRLEGFPQNITSAMEIDPSKDYTRDDKVVEATLGTALGAAHLAAVAAVAKRRKMTPVVYRYHQSRPAVVTVGSWYRAALLPQTHELDDDEVLTEPAVPVFQPPFPPKKEQEKTPPLVAVG